MALIDDAKVALRVTTDRLDSEVQMLVDAAVADMRRVGVPDDLLYEDTMDPYVKAAVILFVKASFGYDNSEASRFQNSYRQMVKDILNSPSTYSRQAGGDQQCDGTT